MIPFDLAAFKESCCIHFVTGAGPRLHGRSVSCPHLNPELKSSSSCADVQGNTSLPATSNVWTLPFRNAEQQFAVDFTVPSKFERVGALKIQPQVYAAMLSCMPTAELHANLTWPASQDAVCPGMTAHQLHQPACSHSVWLLLMDLALACLAPSVVNRHVCPAVD